MLGSSLRSTGQPGAAATSVGGVGNGMRGGIESLAASGMTAQQLHQLATAQQQLQQQPGGVNEQSGGAAAAAAAAAQQAALIQAATAAGLAMPLPGMNAPGIAVAGAPPFPLAAAAAPPQPSNVNSPLSVASENPTPPLDSAAGKAAAASAAAADLTNEDQLHRLQCRLHSERSPSITAEGMPYGASPPLGDASGAPAVAAVAGATSARPMNRAASSGPMDDDTLDILWGMVMDEGNTSGKAGAGRL